jgi:hypothetical protein
LPCNRAVELVQIVVAWNLNRPEPRQMRCDELRVQQRVAALNQPRDEMDEGNLARVALTAEHALAEKSRAQRNAVQPANKNAIAPALNGMCIATRV